MFNDLYSSPNIIRVFKSRRMGWDGHVARMKEKRGAYRITLKWTFKKWDAGAWTGLSWLRIGTGGGLL
jgi:hypothetical protein